MTRIERVSLFLHGWRMRFLQPLIRWNLRRRGRKEPGYLARIPERFGLYEKPVLCAGFIWVHAVSLGETRASAVLIEALRGVWPEMRLLMTHSTATGWEQGQALLGPGDEQVWLPWDTPDATQRFLRHYKPRLGILMETEVWPCLVEACVKACVPLVLANARMSEKSLRWAWLSTPAYGRLSVVLAQTEDDAGRLRQLGASVQGVLGNLKYDVREQPDALSKAVDWRFGWTDCAAMHSVCSNFSKWVCCGCWCPGVIGPQLAAMADSAA
jgi:3-deoxy-D-manno-octulosonic-acid transferase